MKMRYGYIGAVALLMCTTPLFGQNVTAGVSASAAVIPQPFASTCSDDDVGGIGWQAHAGIAVARGLSIRARYSAVHELDFTDCVLEPGVQPDGIHRFRTYDSAMWGDALRTVDVQAAFVPPSLRVVQISAGVGFEVDSSVPFVIAGAGLRIGSQLQLLLGGEVLMLHTPYVVMEEEWQNFQMLRRTEVEKGHQWKRAWLIHIGGEFPLFGR